MPLSIHKSKQPALTWDQFGFFLAGLIDADGHINKLGNFVIAFHAREAEVAYHIKMRIGYGTVSSVKNKKAVTYIWGLSGKRLMAQLIFGKLINPDRVEQFNARLVPKGISALCKPSQVRLNNHWLAGFIQGDGSFQIKIISRANRSLQEIRLVIQIDLKHPYILKQIHSVMGGFLGKE